MSLSRQSVQCIFSFLSVQLLIQLTICLVRGFRHLFLRLSSHLHILLFTLFTPLRIPPLLRQSLLPNETVLGILLHNVYFLSWFELSYGITLAKGVRGGGGGCERTSPKFRCSAFTKNTDKYQGRGLNIIPFHYPPVQGEVPYWSE